jgi:hypothetical protein
MGVLGTYAVGTGVGRGPATVSADRGLDGKDALAVRGPDDKGYASAKSTPSLNLPESSALTIEFWIRHDGTSQENAVVVEKNPNSSQGYQVALYGNGQQPRVWFGVKWPNDRDWSMRSSSGIPTGTWTHVACVYNGNQQAIYIDGELDGTRTDWDGQEFNGNDGDLVVGATTAKNDRFLAAEIDDLRIWNTSRELLEIQSNRFTKLNGDEDGLVAYYPLDGSLADGTNSNDLETTGSAALAGRGVAPTPPLLYTRAGDGAVEATWTPRGAEEQGVAEYRLYHGTSIDGSDRSVAATFGADTTSTTVDAANDTVHYYWVTAVDGDETESGFSYPAVAFPSTRPSGRALSFPGDDSYVTVDDRPVLDVPKGNELTIEFWVNHDGESDEDAVIVEKNTDNANGYQVSFEGSGAGVKVWFGIKWPNDRDWSMRSSSGVPSGQWTHVACVYDGQRQAIYIDGELDDTRTDWDGQTVNANDAPLRFGAHQSEDKRFFSGQLDEVRIWNTAQNKEKIQEHYQTELFGNDTDLAGYWRTCDDDTLHGSVGTAMTGASNNVSCGASDIDLAETSEGDGPTDGGDGTTTDDGGGTTTDDGGGTTTDGTTVADADSDRGFLFNGEQSILDFLNETMLTVIGILLSILGILYEMVGGGR